MTVSSTTTRNSYTGDGSTTVFAYTFKIFDDDDITVILRTTATGTETVQTKTTHYSVSGVGSAGGGNITFVAAPTAAQTVVLLRQTAQTQTTDYTPNDPFPAASHEDALDKMTLIIQDQQDELDRAIKLSRTNTMTSTEFTVGASDRASKVLAFDTSGELSVTQELGTFRGNWSASTAFAERDLIKDTTNNNIYLANTAHTSSGSLPISTNADSSKWDLIVDAAAATTSATNAATSATAAAASATAAAASEAAAATSETNAAASEAGVAADAAAAAASASSASTSATNAATSETNAATSASAASTSASNAATSATSASNSATSASTSASNAATSATNASNSASAASTSASNAATSETNAATSESNAAASASSAASDASAAASSAAAAAASFDAFDDIYLGAKASAPTVDNDGDALTAGDQYFNTTNSTLYVWNGSAWQSASPDIVADITPQLGGNLDTNGNDINFGDNDKAVFGAGSDLQIYHDGSNSYIDETISTGVGSLIIRANNLLAQNSLDEPYFQGITNGAFRIYYDGSTKLATTSGGIDVTGTVTSDGLYVNDDNGIVFDGPTSAGSPVVYVARNDSTTNSGNTLGEIMFTSNDGVTGSDVTTETDAPVILRSTAGENHSTTNRGGDFRILTKANGTANSGNATQRVLIYNNGDVALYDSTGVTQGFYWDASTQRLGINTTTPGARLQVGGNAKLGSATQTTFSGSLTTGGVDVMVGSGASSAGAFQVWDDNELTTPRFTVTREGNVGIGTVPNAGMTALTALQLGYGGGFQSHASSTNSIYVLSNAYYDGAWKYKNAGAATEYKGINGEHIWETATSGAADGALTWSEAMRITSDGSVGIGVSTPSGKLHLSESGATNAAATIFSLDGYHSTFGANLAKSSGTYTTPASSLSGGAWEYQPVNSLNGHGHMIYLSAPDTNSTASTPLERLRIDSSGNLLVGKTSANTTVEGFQTRAGGITAITRDGNLALNANRLTSDGDIMVFQKDSTTVGRIGTGSGYVYIVLNVSSVGIGGYGPSVVPTDGTGTYIDNSKDVGHASYRWDDIYATNGTIQTSDANEKQDIEELTDAEQRVAVAAKGLLRKYRWKSSVEEKGDDARIHFGIIAQDLQAAFEAEGLDAGRYAMFINSEWTDEETGEQKSRMGIRYNQLLAFIIAGI